MDILLQAARRYLEHIVAQNEAIFMLLGLNTGLLLFIIFLLWKRGE